MPELRIFSLDLPGHGYSDHRPSGSAYYFIDMVMDVIEVADVLGLEKFSLLGHSMGAAGAIELAGNIPSLEDGMVHATLNVEELDPNCALPGLVSGDAVKKKGGIKVILNNSFGMLGINSVLILKKFEA